MPCRGSEGGLEDLFAISHLDSCQQRWRVSRSLAQCPCEPAMMSVLAQSDNNIKNDGLGRVVFLLTTGSTYVGP